MACGNNQWPLLLRRTRFAQEVLLLPFARGVVRPRGRLRIMSKSILLGDISDLLGGIPFSRFARSIAGDLKVSSTDSSSWAYVIRLSDRAVPQYVLVGAEVGPGGPAFWLSGREHLPHLGHQMLAPTRTVGVPRTTDAAQKTPSKRPCEAMAATKGAMTRY